MKRTRKSPLQLRQEAAEEKADRLFVELMRKLRGCRNVQRLIVFVPGRDRPLVHDFFEMFSPAKSA